LTLRLQEFETNWEESRQGRVDSWMSFQKNATGKTKEKKTKKFSPIGFRPPKTKPESR
jgi:DnaJ family protein C protein 8